MDVTANEKSYGWCASSHSIFDDHIENWELFGYISSNILTVLQEDIWRKPPAMGMKHDA
jgi:hypothetical protein